MRWIEEQAEQEADNPDFAEQEAARRRRMDEEACQKIEADCQAAERPVTRMTTILTTTLRR